jgi:hypothetical protein
MPANLTSFAFNCSLKSSRNKEKSSTDRILRELLDGLSGHGVETAAPVRAADFDIKPGVLSDEGEGDDWPELRRQILAADIFVFGLPIWIGQPSSVAKRVMERMDAFLSETDDRGRMPAADKVALVAIVGNEDGVSLPCQMLSGAERCRFHDSSECRRLLGRRSDGQGQLCRSCEISRRCQGNNGHGGGQRGPPGAC